MHASCSCIITSLCTICSRFFGFFFNDYDVFDPFYICCLPERCFLCHSHTGTCSWPGVRSEDKTPPPSLKTRSASRRARQGWRQRENVACVFIDRRDFERNIFDSIPVHQYLNLKPTVNCEDFKGRSRPVSASMATLSAVPISYVVGVSI